MQKPIELLLTLLPSFGHFAEFQAREDIAGIRLNSAMVSGSEVVRELETLATVSRGGAPLFFDIKGRQPRVAKVEQVDTGLKITMNHPIEVPTPCTVWFKGGTDKARLHHLEGDGSVLLFEGYATFKIQPGESLHFPDGGMKLKPRHGSIFPDAEKEKIALVRRAGFRRYFLSYVETQRDIDEFEELVGSDAEIWLKIETETGLRFVEREFRKTDRHILVAARGDLYVELGFSPKILPACQLIAQKDPEACVASRLLLSLMRTVDQKEEEVQPDGSRKLIRNIRREELRGTPPECSDYSELLWLRHGCGFHRFLICDEMCHRREALRLAVTYFNEFRRLIES